MSLAAGDRLGSYELLAPLGAGGMGEVWRARDTKLERDVAVKVLPKRVATDPEAIARFGREAKAIAALSHPNILAIHDFGTHGDTRPGPRRRPRQGDRGALCRETARGPLPIGARPRLRPARRGR
jgi:hypothetical protein